MIFAAEPNLGSRLARFFSRDVRLAMWSPGLKWEDFNVPKVDVNDLRRPSTLARKKTQKITAGIS